LKVRAKAKLGKLSNQTICPYDGWAALEMAGRSRMSGPASLTIAPCSRPSTPLRAAGGGGIRPALTAAMRGASRKSGLDGETPLSRTKKLLAASCGAKGEEFDEIRAG
jgi:hypothetical protein